MEACCSGKISSRPGSRRAKRAIRRDEIGVAEDLENEEICAPRRPDAATATGRASKRFTDVGSAISRPEVLRTGRSGTCPDGGIGDPS